MSELPVFGGYETKRGNGFALIRTDGSVEEFPATHVTYLKRQDVRGNSLPRRVEQLTSSVTLEHKRWLRLECASHRRWDLRDVLRQTRLTPWESDISPMARHLAESDVRLASMSDLDVLLFDIEVDDTVPFQEHFEGQAPILSFSWKQYGEGTVRHHRLEAPNARAERALIRRLLRLMTEHHVVSAWNIPYDLPVTKARCEVLGIEFPWHLIMPLCMLATWRKHFKRGESGEQLSSFAIDAVGENVLGRRKVDLRQLLIDHGHAPPSGRSLIRWAYDNDPEAFERYNNTDVELMEAAEERKGFLGLQIELAKLCRTFPTDGSGPHGFNSLAATRLADSVFVRWGRANGVHWPTRPDDAKVERRKAEKLKGALVLEPSVGVHENVVMPDYSGLYPNIMKALNISLETLVGEDFRGPVAEAPNGATFRTDIRGAIPVVIDGFLKRRMVLKARSKDATTERELIDAQNRSEVFKVFCNSIYGILGEPYSRWYNLACASAVTSTGEQLLRIGGGVTKREFGGRVVMGDTDGWAAAGVDDPNALIDAAMNAVSRWAKRNGFVQTEFVIEHETTFDKLAIFKKKRYAGVASFYKGAHLDEPKIEVKGLECMRSDGVRLMRVVQRRVLEMFLLEDCAAQDVRAYLDDVRERLFDGEYEAHDLELSQRLQKQPRDYKSHPPHVDVAKAMAKAGGQVFVGQKIPYIVVGYHGKRLKAVHPDEFDGQYSGRLIWQKHVWPPLKRVVEVIWPGEPWYELDVSVEPGPKVHPDQMALGLPPPPVKRREVRRDS